MRIRKSDHDFRSVEEWYRWAPPKRQDIQWKDGRSAKELARSWFRSQLPAPPDELRLLLESAFGTDIEFEEAEPERIIELDEFRGGQRNCDLVILCKRKSLRLVINVEAKADEPFGDRVGHYYDRKLKTGSNVPKRIGQLSSALFGRQPDSEIRNLRYQLLHSAAATLIEAATQKAGSALFLVHEFHSAALNPGKIEQNMADWTAFVRAFPGLPTVGVERNQILGPISVAGHDWVPSSIPLYLGHLVTELRIPD